MKKYKYVLTAVSIILSIYYYRSVRMSTADERLRDEINTINTQIAVLDHVSELCIFGEYEALIYPDDKMNGCGPLPSNRHGEGISNIVVFGDKCQASIITVDKRTVSRQNEMICRTAQEAIPLAVQHTPFGNAIGFKSK